MKKRILLLSSSPRRHGNSDRLCDEFLRGAREAGHDAEKISLRDCRIGYCTGCGVCYDTRTCPQRDDAAQIVGKMIAADVIVLATPVYFYTMSAQMKTLIDRCCARYTEMTGKEFYFIVAAADDSKAAMERTIDGFRGFLDCLDDSRECGTIYGVGAWKIGEIEGSPARSGDRRSAPFALLKSAGRLYVLGSVARGEMTDCAGCSRRRAFKCPVMRAGYVAHLNDK